MVRLLEKFRKEISPSLKEELKLENDLAVPRMMKVVVSVGVKEGAKDKGIIEKVKNQIEAVTGQVARVCRAKKSVAAFSLGKGNPIGLMVTLRGKRMYDFVEKIFSVILPRTRDFQGVSQSGFDGKGNFNLGIPEMVVFPEVDFSKLDRSRGLQITIVTNAEDDEKAKKLLEKLGIPFRKN